MSDIESIIDGASPPTTSVRICVAGDLSAQFEELEAQLAEAKNWKPDSLGDASPTRDLAQRMETLREQMREHEHTFTFRGLSTRAWSDLVAHHPPRDDKDEAWNLETLPVALIAACAVDPEMSVEQAERLCDRLSQGQWDELFSTAYRITVRKTDIPFSSLAYGILHDTEQK